MESNTKLDRSLRNVEARKKRPRQNEEGSKRDEEKDREHLVFRYVLATLTCTCVRGQEFSFSISKGTSSVRPKLKAEN